MQANVALAVTIMAIATLSTLIPSSPGYVGPFHLAAFFAIKILGGSAEQATSFAVLAHLSVWLRHCRRRHRHAVDAGSVQSRIRKS